MTDTTHEAPERIWAGKYHGTWWQSHPHHQMTEYVRADRIEELERIVGLADDQRREWERHCKEAEAKLAKAETIVRILASAEWDDRLGEAVDLACAYVAEVGEEK